MAEITHTAEKKHTSPMIPHQSILSFIGIVSGAILSCALFFTCSKSVKRVAIEYPTDIPQVVFAVEEVQKSLIKNGFQVDPDANIHIQFIMNTKDFGEQCYNIQSVADTLITVTGGDARGLLYGGLELAEQISLKGSLVITNTDGEPYIDRRGIKFNIPLDARTPSYDDTGDAAQNNYAEMWSWEFWTEFLDNMAIHRYNTLTLWNPHPFPTMIKMDEYPDIALDDVYVTTLKPEGRGGEFADPQLVSDNIFDNLKMVNKMTIDEKITFWRKVMQYAKDRGIDIYFITWNICPNSVAVPFKPFHRTWGDEFIKEKPGKYGITHEINNPKTTVYYRKAVRTFLLTYPDLKGIGVTAGEHMPPDSEKHSREKWLWETYGLGILDAKKEQPDRTVHFIHRVWYSDMDKIMKYWGQYPDPFDLSFKYAKAHMYSSSDIPFAKGQVEKMKPYGLKCWWNMRNDDIFVHRWGDPDFARAFLKNFPQENTAGYHMGSDGYVWGREFVTQDLPTVGQLEIVKHWYKFLLWGRLGFNPELDESFFIQKISERYPETDAKLLYQSWQVSSKIIPQLNRFHWRDWDFMMAPEACISSAGFRTVIDFTDNPTMEEQGIINPTQYVESTLAGQKISDITPIQVATNLQKFAAAAVSGVDKLNKNRNSEDLKMTLSDITAMSFLGQYYSEKILAAVDVVFYQKSGKESYKTAAIGHLETAVQYWENYTNISIDRYTPQVLARTQVFDWLKILNDVKKDVVLVQNLKVIED